MSKKVLVIGIIIILMFTFIIPSVRASDLGLGDLSQYGTQNDNGTTRVRTLIGDILGVIQIIGTIISIVMLIVIGIKYMTGSVEERSEYKQTLKPYIIGAFLLFSGTLVPSLVYQIAQNI